MGISATQKELYYQFFLRYNLFLPLATCKRFIINIINIINKKKELK